MLAVVMDDGTVGVDVFQLAVPPDIASFLDVHFVVGPLEDDHFFDRRFA